MAEKKHKIYSYTIVLEPVEEGGYTVLVPTLPGIVTQGDDEAQAVAMAEDAIRCHIEALLKDGEPVPEEKQGVTLKEIAISV